MTNDVYFQYNGGFCETFTLQKNISLKKKQKNISWCKIDFQLQC